MPITPLHPDDDRSLLGQKVAIVTGASDATAAHLARMLAASGAAVLLTDVELEPIEGLAAEIRAAGGQAQAGLLNVLMETDWQSSIAQALDQFGGVDILVNKSAAGRLARFADCRLEDFQLMQNQSVAGAFLGIKHAMRAMRPDGSVGRGGSIINFTPTLQLNGLTGMGGFFAAKGAVRLLSKAAALECASLGYDIRVNSIHPVRGDAASDWSLVRSLADADDALSEFSPEDSGREGSRLSDLVLYLASDVSQRINGRGFVVGESNMSDFAQSGTA